MIHIVQLGSSRGRSEGPRLGTVRRPPRGVPKSEFASRDFYDVWMPELAPSAPLVVFALSAATDRQWAVFVKRYRAEMGRAPASHILDTLALLSRTTNLSVGCYCKDERRCHRSVLRQLLSERGGHVANTN